MKKKVQKTEEKQQLDMGFKDPFGNKVAKFKTNVSKGFVKFETKRFFKAAQGWLFGGISTGLIATQLYYLIQYLDDIPDQVPLFQSSLDLALRLADKTQLFIIPGLSIAIILVTLYTGLQLFNSRKELIMFSLINMLSSIGILTFVLLRVFSAYV